MSIYSDGLQRQKLVLLQELKDAYGMGARVSRAIEFTPPVLAAPEPIIRTITVVSPVDAKLQKRIGKLDKRIIALQLDKAALEQRIVETNKPLPAVIEPTVLPLLLVEPAPVSRAQRFKSWVSKPLSYFKKAA